MYFSIINEQVKKSTNRLFIFGHIKYAQGIYTGPEVWNDAHSQEFMIKQQAVYRKEIFMERHGFAMKIKKGQMNAYRKKLGEIWRGANRISGQK